MKDKQTAPSASTKLQERLNRLEVIVGVKPKRTPDVLFVETTILSAPSEKFQAETYQVMPSLSDAAYAALRESISQNGVRVPVEYDETGNILDGHHRVRACKELGLEEWPKVVREGLSEQEKKEYARQVNLARRHLTSKQKRQLVADQVRETPDKSNRQIAAICGVDDKTVAVVRRKMAEGAEIPHPPSPKSKQEDEDEIVIKLTLTEKESIQAVMTREGELDMVKFIQRVIFGYCKNSTVVPDDAISTADKDGGQP